MSCSVSSNSKPLHKQFTVSVDEILTSTVVVLWYGSAVICSAVHLQITLADLVMMIM